jgi:putative cell wall-binding protein
MTAVALVGNVNAAAVGEGFDAGVTRLSGADRYATSVSVAQRSAPGVAVVFVANGENFPDALGASAAAAHLGGPLLLTTPAVLPSNVEAEIQRLEPTKIIVAGGPASVSATVEARLAAIAPTSRVAGADRFETNIQTVRAGFTSASFAVVATGHSFPDALSGTGVAGLKGGPVVLVDGNVNTLPAATLTMLDSLGVTRIAVAGGPGSVSQALLSQLSSEGFEVTRHSGSDRYATSAALNDTFFAPGSSPTEFLATGETFPDALAGSALAGSLRAPMYVTAAPCVPDSVRASRVRLGAVRTVVLGGTAVVSENSANNAPCIRPDVPPPGVKLSGCPAEAPIKGNRNSMIYHMPTDRYYSVTTPEECFRTEVQAQAAGYRAAKV